MLLILEFNPGTKGLKFKIYMKRFNFLDRSIITTVDGVRKKFQ
jgi:hypothetical protein